MDKVWNHNNFESKIYHLWEKSKSFTPQITSHKLPFTIIMPPPNASDPLHFGHARFVAVEDTIIRYMRMKGFSALWLPGADHAGIETQFVFEKKLAKSGKSRFDFSRETLYKMIWDDVADNRKTMELQLKILGASCDWSRFFYTLDPKIVAIVYKTFKKLSDDGLIYRGNRIVNFCPRCGTAFSQLEVNYVERDDPLYFIDYDEITIATTRPETIFADVAVAVNPKDNKNKNKIGLFATLPILARKLPIIGDNLVDPNFGTGALKITPGHDPVDFEIGQEHGLEAISVIDKAGKMIDTPQKYLGLSVVACREEVVKDLQSLGKIKKIETIHHTVGTCYRDKGLLEPLLSEQWFVKVESLAKNALSTVSKGRVKFVSTRYHKIAVHWLKNLKDWNISRQIVWGIQIPAFKCTTCGLWTVTDGVKPKTCSHCKNHQFIQDSDTFDTWFSSGQWPYATLKSAKPGDFKKYYPTDLMETAYDILPFWVLRMIMLGIYVTGEAPFKKVLIHGLVRDKEGQKISKSRGNVIDPIEMSKKYGSDALRMGIIWGSLVENDISLSEDNIRAQRNFSNKVWNISRFVLQNKTNLPFTNYQLPKSSDADDNWILKELKKTVKKETKALDKYRLNEAAEIIYDFIWHKFADKYLESIKSRRESAQPTLAYVLATSLKLLHPLMPFVTEAIWQNGIAKDKKDLLINAAWPKV